MPALKKFYLLASHASETSTAAFKEIAKGPALPNLEEIEFWCVTAECADFITFVRKHLRTLETVNPDFLELENGSEEDLQLLLHDMRDAAITHNLINFTSMLIRLNDDSVRFPELRHIWFEDLDDPDFDDWVRVGCSENMYLKGKTEVVEGLEVMIGCMEVGW